MTIEEIYKDREMFANEVENVAKADLDKMGLEIKTFTIRDIDDVAITAVHKLRWWEKGKRCPLHAIPIRKTHTHARRHTYS